MRCLYNDYMARPKTKTELLEASAAQFGKLLAAVETLSADVITAPGACEEWSIKDILAHLHEWHKLYLTWYTEGMADKKPEMPAPGYTWKTTPDLNAHIFEKNKDIPLTEILGLLESSHQEIMAVIERHTNEELFTRKYYAWTGATSLGSYTVSTTSSHYDWANRHIERFLKTI